MSFHILISQIEKWQCKNLKWERSCDPCTEITLKIFRWSHPLFKSVSFRWFFSPSIQNLVGVNRVQEIFNLKENRFKEFLFWLIVHQLQIYLHANYWPSRMENVLKWMKIKKNSGPRLSHMGRCGTGPRPSSMGRCGTGPRPSRMGRCGTGLKVLA